MSHQLSLISCDVPVYYCPTAEQLMTCFQHGYPAATDDPHTWRHKTFLHKPLLMLISSTGPLHTTATNNSLTMCGNTRTTPKLLSSVADKQDTVFVMNALLTKTFNCRAKTMHERTILAGTLPQNLLAEPTVFAWSIGWPVSRHCCHKFSQPYLLKQAVYTY